MKRLLAATLFLTTGLTACKKDPPIYTDYPFHLSYIIDGVRKEYWGIDELKSPVFFTVSQSRGTANSPDSIYLGFGSICQFTRNSSLPNFSIEHILIEDTLLVNNGGVYYDYNNFRKIFSSGQKQFTDDDCKFSGVVISYWNEEQVLYSTTKSHCDSIKPIIPDHSKFRYEVVSSEVFNDRLFGKSEKVVAKFYCTLYSFSGDSIVIKDGTMESVFQE